ncbi:MAG: MerR family transcriptional regulator [Planctomycetes bacterium]|nr:MerR family transcriptional regulator [Planctomycetota bacterium]
MTTPVETSPSTKLDGLRISLASRLASMTRGEAERLLRQRGATLVDKHQDQVDWIVVGDDSKNRGAVRGSLPPAWRAAVDAGKTRIVLETDLWRRLGLIEAEPHVQHLYTAAMLAELLGVPVAMVRGWQTRGLLRPTAQVHRLAYFDFAELATARKLIELRSAGLSTGAIAAQLAQLRQLLPDVERPLAELSLAVDGGRLLVHRDDRLVDPGGQLQLDFDADDATATPSILSEADLPRSPEELCALAAELDEQGRGSEAAEMYRAALAAGGPDPEIGFALAELLYRLHETAAAAERYYMVLELDEDYVEARANLGCVLAELGRHELALAALNGALACHPNYADAHYHLARLLDELDRRDEAQAHWQAFLELAADSPWAESARQRLQHDSAAQ